MSSIAYVADEKMLEYHRLSGNRDIIFWRLSSQKKFSNFEKGDLLFFYAKSHNSKRKGFVGYAHYDSVKRMSLRSMWKKYGNTNGYDTYEQLKEAIEKAARDKQIPEEMNCLYLRDVVFFVSPVYPEDVGLQISQKLESYCYLDQNDPQTTIKILQSAEHVGIDTWAASQSNQPMDTFREDEIRHTLAVIAKRVNFEEKNQTYLRKSKKIAKECLKHSGWELVRTSAFDCAKISSEKVVVAFPFVSNNKDKEERMQEFFGKVLLYRLYLEQSSFPIPQLRFECLSEEDEPEIRRLLEKINHEEL